MGQTTFSGPIKAGTIQNTTGTTVGEDRANVGSVVMAQSAAWSQSTTAAATGIVIPANSQIVEISVFVNTACNGASQNLSVGTSSTSTEIFTALALGTGANDAFLGSSATITDGDVWENVGTSDVEIYVDFSAGTTGRGTITVQYVQNNNLS
jgi:hypothetical protein